MDPRHTDAKDEQFLLNMIGEGQGDVPEQADYGSNTDIYLNMSGDGIEPNVAADHLSQRKSSCASTDVAVAEPTGIQAAVEASAPQRFPVDEITQRTPCDLQIAVKNLIHTTCINQATCTTGNKFHLDTHELAWSRCARVGRRSSLIFLKAMGRGH